MAFINFVILHSKMHLEMHTPCHYSAAVPKMWNKLLRTRVLHCFFKLFPAGNNPSFSGLSGGLNPVCEVVVSIQIFENLDKIVLQKTFFKTKLLTNSHHFWACDAVK